MAGVGPYLARAGRNTYSENCGRDVELEGHLLFRCLGHDLKLQIL